MSFSGFLFPINFNSCTSNLSLWSKWKHEEEIYFHFIALSSTLFASLSKQSIAWEIEVSPWYWMEVMQTVEQSSGRVSRLGIFCHSSVASRWRKTINKLISQLFADVILSSGLVSCFSITRQTSINTAVTKQQPLSTIDQDIWLGIGIY